MANKRVAVKTDEEQREEIGEEILRNQIEASFRRGRRIVQSNILTEAAYSLTRNQKRLIWMCMSRMPRTESEIKDSLGRFTIAVDEYAAHFNLPSSAASRDIREALQDFHTRTITVYRPKHDSETEKALDTFSWVIGSGSRPKVGHYIMTINPSLLPFMVKLKRDFTSYWTPEIEGFNNPYAARLFESICQYRGNRKTGYVTLDIEWIRERYQLPDSYEKMSTFDRCFMTPALKEINEKTSMVVTVDKIKRGRVVTKIRFDFINNGIKDDEEVVDGEQTDLRLEVEEPEGE